MKEYRFCPMCKSGLIYNQADLLQCTACAWVHYDNPTPVVCGLIPVNDEGMTPTPENSGLVLIKRGVQPFKGQWALPAGFLNRHENPKAGACREILEETSLIVRLEKILCICNPMPGEINQITISYLARVYGGEMKAGDDAMDIGIFDQDDLPDICFRSHRMLVRRWFKGDFGSITGEDLN